MLVRDTVFLALDAAAVSAAAVGSGVGGRRLLGFARVPLAAGALVAAPSATKAARPDEVRGAVRGALDALARAASRVTLVLPDGLARLALVALPADADARDFVRFRLAASLPWEPSDTIVDVLPVGRGRVVAAALRRATVAEYEHVAASAGLEVERVHLAPLLALEAASRGGPREAVHVVLGDAAVCFAAVREGAIAALRSRRRDLSAGESARLAEEAIRTARLAGDGDAPPRIVLSGSDAPRLRAEIGSAELAGVSGRQWPQAAEAAWLRGVTA